MRDVVERVFRLGFHVPLAGEVSVVAGLLHVLGPEPTRLSLLLGFFVDPIGAPEVAAGIEHGPAGDTHGAAPRSLVERLREGRAASHEPIEVRRLDLIATERPDRLVALVVRKDEENIGFRFLLLGDADAGEEQGHDQGKGERAVLFHTGYCTGNAILHGEITRRLLVIVDVACRTDHFIRRNGLSPAEIRIRRFQLFPDNA